MNYHPAKKPKLRIRFLFSALAAAAFLGGLVYASVRFDFFSVNGLEVRETFFTDEDVIVNKLIANIAGGSPLKALLGPENVLFWIFRENPEIVSNELPIAKSINVRLVPFEKKVLVDVREREIFGVWCLPAPQDMSPDRAHRAGERQADAPGDCYGFDNEGVVFTEAPDVYGNLVLKVEDLTGRNLHLGQKALANEDWLRAIWKTFGEIRDFGLVVEKISVKDFNLREWEVKISDGPTFYFSFGFEVSDLKGVLKRLIGEFGLMNREYVDFRVENRIYYK